jgi:hypothetical protein
MGGSHIEGPLIGKIDLNSTVKRKYKHSKSNGYFNIEPGSWKEYKRGIQDEKRKAVSAQKAINQEYWDALRRHKGIEVREADNSDGQ